MAKSGTGPHLQFALVQRIPHEALSCFTVCIICCCLLAIPVMSIIHFIPDMHVINSCAYYRLLCTLHPAITLPAELVDMLACILFTPSSEAHFPKMQVQRSGQDTGRFHLSEALQACGRAHVAVGHK